MTKEVTPDIQGEGDYKAARRYRKDVKEFVETHDVEGAARDAAPTNSAEANELDAAEAKGRARSKAPNEK